ncbi:MAG: efflux RND transporter permease subunit [Planctomycetes bacterium]|nr:efflux RND transporter permease subunit [Planctomycetota bacterium]
MSKKQAPDAIGGMIDTVIRFCLENKLIVALVLLVIVGWGMMVMPFDYDPGWFPRDPVPVDAIPDIGENQQIVFTKWMGRSPEDVEDQITYPLTVSLMGVPGVKTIRSYSYLGFSSICVVFDEDVEFYWSRSRILERLSVAQKDLPAEVTPALGPDATSLGQVFWYTLEGCDVETGEPTGGWDLDELRTTQDWNVRYALQSAKGVSEVASVGGFALEYQIDVDPDAMRANHVTLSEIYSAVRKSNIDVGARTIEINKVEYVIRGVGFIRKVEDLEDTVIKSVDNVPIYIRQIAKVSKGPAFRRGALDKSGAEAVGGVVVVRHGENPLEVIKNVQAKIDEIAPGLPRKTLADGRVSQITVVPFYDRTTLIRETLGTLETALSEEILVTIIVVLVMVMHMRSSLLISGLLPLAVAMAFIGMKVFGVDSNIMSLSGIAIAIGTMVDMGVILCENILKHLDEADPDERPMEVIFRATSEVARPVLTAILTTVISFLPVFVMIGAEGKLFKPLAYTKTFALLASVIVALTLIPPVAHLLFSFRIDRRRARFVVAQLVIVAGIAGGWWIAPWVGLVLLILGLYLNVRDYLPASLAPWVPRAANVGAIVFVLVVLTRHWMPLGVDEGMVRNIVFITTLIGSLLAGFLLFMHFYAPLLRFFLAHKLLFYCFPVTSCLLGLVVWQGFETIFGFVPATAERCGIAERDVRGNAIWTWAKHEFPGMGKEFMPSLDEGSYLLMPSTMPHASIGESMDALRKQDMAVQALPEIDLLVGKIGRVESPLDPAPVAMVETIINYKPEYLHDNDGRRLTFRFDAESVDWFRDLAGDPLPAPDGKPYKVRGTFVRDDDGHLIPDPAGRPFRLWRPPLELELNEDREEAWPGVRNSNDIWKLIERAAKVPGSTSASKLQPIAARIVMLQSGVRAAMAVRIRGDKLEDIERVALAVQEYLKEVPGVEPAAVNADHIVGKPYLEIEIDRQAIGRYGVSIRDVQDVIETAIGGQTITTTIEGRKRFPVRVRYQRELRDSIESLGRVLIAAKDGTQVPLEELAEIRFKRGPGVIKSEDTRLVGYVTFDKKDGFAEVDLVEACREYLDAKIRDGQLVLPAGVERPAFIGSYENQVRSEKTLLVVVPLALFLIFIILYLQFRAVSTTLLIFMGVFVACSGGFILLWLYGTPWFLDFDVFGQSMRELFQVRQYNLSVAVWVGFIALLGIATDDGVIVASYLDQSFARKKPTSIKEIREATVGAGQRRIRPCLMTTATTILALIPVLTSTGRGSDVMVPMAIPSFGGMSIELMTLFFVPVSYCTIREFRLKFSRSKELADRRESEGSA